MPREKKPKKQTIYRRDYVTIETADKIKLEYRIANPLLRLGAFLIDFVILVFIFLLILTVLFYTFLGNLLGGVFAIDKFSALLAAFLFILIFILRWFYYLFFEMLFEGRSPGKMMCGIRVIHYQGKPLDLPALVLRNFARALDQEITFFLGAFICMLVNREYRRIGDLLSNTIVVKDERPVAPEKALRFTLPAVQPDKQALDSVLVRRLSEEELYILRRFLTEQAKIPQPDRADLLARMASGVREKIQDSVSPSQPLEYLLAVYLRHQEAHAVK